MNIVEKEAKRFSRDLEHIVATMDNVQSKISSKLYSFNREKDRLEFLSILRNDIRDKKIEHELVCTGCGKSDDYDTIIFGIEQEYESINRFFTPETKEEDKFSDNEEMNIYNTLNEILENLSHLKMGQEILYDEIDVLKQHFSLGKKSWFQLLQIKLVSLCGDQIIEKSVAENIYHQLANEVNNVTNYIGTQL